MDINKGAANQQVLPELKGTDTVLPYRESNAEKVLFLAETQDLDVINSASATTAQVQNKSDTYSCPIKNCELIVNIKDA
eukprot:164385-Ditylum_brightwellii.AAC.1